MGLVKCPRCELNYIQEGEKYCDVCRRSMRREKEPEEVAEMCAECGENPAVKGSDLCAECLREQRRQKKLENAAHGRDENPLLDIDDSDSLQEIELPMGGDIPESEYEEIHREFPLDDDEEEDEDEEDE